MIITLVSTCRNLHSPMYFFLSHLSLTDIMITTTIVPFMLHVIQKEGSIMSFPGCLIQFYFFGHSTATECFLLTVMSYDRYLAICNPLRYASIMDLRLCLHLVIFSWLLGMLFTLIPVFNICQLQFCGSIVIDHFFCDYVPLLEHSCSDTSSVEIGNVIQGIPTLLSPLILITVSYVCIFLTILKIPSTTGRQKAFSTCSSHLAVVCLYYGTLIINYTIPSKGHSLNPQKILSLLYTVVTPLFNPIIYSLKNEEIKTALKKMTCFIRDGCRKI
ncbi:olfactory receptor 11G2-like [Ascaphus truei]|uniref:olfactory receptor 11G2-like n=1 Tax=Ascaphus truei TaxID=8439 RepID=UPI003F5935FC